MGEKPKRVVREPRPTLESEVAGKFGEDMAVDLAALRRGESLGPSIEPTGRVKSYLDPTKYVSPEQRAMERQVAIYIRDGAKADALKAVQDLIQVISAKQSE